MAAGKVVVDIVLGYRVCPDKEVMLARTEELHSPIWRSVPRNALWNVRQQDAVQNADLSDLGEQCRLRCMIAPMESTCSTPKDQLMRLWVATAREVFYTSEETLIG